MTYCAIRDNALFGDPPYEDTFHDADTTSDQDEEMIEDSLSNHFDLSRLPPRIYDGLSKSRMAIRDEISNLLKMHNGSTAAVRIVDAISIQYHRVEEIRTTLAVKIKAGNRHKSRMCLRGDQESLIQSSFPSAPTISKELVKLALSTYVNLDGMICATVDISQALLQSDVMPVSSQISAYHPDCVFLDDVKWNGAISLRK